MLERGEIDRKTLMWHRFAAFGEQCDLSPMDPHAFCATYVEKLSQKSYPMDGAVEVCAALAERYTMAVITNGNAVVQRGRFEPSPLRPYFARCFVSETVGVNKPEMAFFAAVCREMPELCPERTLVIGDSLTSDIAGGKTAGIATCWFNPKSKQGRETIKPDFEIRALGDFLSIVI
jgi:2-haloacid dehalogenase